MAPSVLFYSTEKDGGAAEAKEYFRLAAAKEAAASEAEAEAGRLRKEAEGACEAYSVVKAEAKRLRKEADNATVLARSAREEVAANLLKMKGEELLAEHGL